MKARSKKKRKQTRAVEAAGFLALILIVAFVVYITIPPQTPKSETHLLRAAIIDELSAEFPNPEFMEGVRSIVGEAGLTVDIYDRVPVYLYAELPAQGYELILFRVHAGVNQEMEGHPVGMYTTELYSEFRYPQEQLSDLVAMGRAYNRSEGPVFAVTPKFIREKSTVGYGGTLVVLMGCYGLFSQELPNAFIERGASVVVGWNGLVSAEHTDKATLALLKALLTWKGSIDESVRSAINEVGPDPDYRSILGYYPKNKGSITFSELFLKPMTLAHISERSSGVWGQCLEIGNSRRRVNQANSFVASFLPTSGVDVSRPVGPNLGRCPIV